MERVAEYCSAQAGQNENMIVGIVWNSGVRLQNASNLKMEIPSLFVLSTTRIVGYFTQPNVVIKPHNFCPEIYMCFSPFLFHNYYEKFYLKPVF